jgi:predicted outer membrane repeat protein
MRCLIEFICVLTLGVMPAVGCGGTTSREFPCTEQGIRDAIAQGGGPHTFDCNGPTTVVTQAEIAIGNSVILDGQGNLTVDGNHRHRLFSVPQGVTAQLLGMTATRGAAKYEPGGGIYNEGTLTLAHSAVTGNEAEGSGGGIATSGALTLINSTVAANTTEPIGDGTSKSEEPRSGGGIQIFVGGSLTSINSTVSGNTSRMGGGIGSNGSVMLTLTNSTVSGNTATWWGGGMYHSTGDATLTNSTLSGNTAPVGGGIYNINHWTPIMLTNVTVSGNTADRGGGVWNQGEVVSSNSLFDDDCHNDESMVSMGDNIESPGNTCGFDQEGDQPSVPDPMLGPLRNNGGPTMTHALEPGSPAINRIPADACEVDTDQRGQPRPEPGGTMCDVGAFEVQP